MAEPIVVSVISSVGWVVKLLEGVLIYGFDGWSVLGIGWLRVEFRLIKAKKNVLVWKQGSVLDGKKIPNVSFCCFLS